MASRKAGTQGRRRTPTPPRGARSKSATSRKRARSLGTDTGPQAKTLVYVHGIGNKPPQHILHCQWDTALFGYALGEQSRFAYWVNRERYPAPLSGTCGSADTLLRSAPEPMGKHVAGRVGRRGPVDPARLADELTTSASEKRVLMAIANRMQAAGKRTTARVPVAPRGARRARLLPFIGPGARESITRVATEHLLPDVHDFLFVPAERHRMLEIVKNRLVLGGGPYVVIGHSLGSVIAYAALQEISQSASPIDVALFLTIGSPLGMQEIREGVSRVLGRSQSARLPFPTCVRQWMNVSDRLDPVAVDADLADDVAGGSLEDVHVQNLDGAFDAHSATGYLETIEVRKRVRAAVVAKRFQRLAAVQMTRDLARAVDASPPEIRTEVLFELSQPLAGKKLTVDDMRERFVDHLKEVRRSRKIAEEDIAIEPLRHYVGACLTQEELFETLFSAKFPMKAKGGIAIEELQEMKPFYRAWRNGTKVALINRSVHTIQAHPAHHAYAATGRDIHWAVLDSGINADHPHFKDNDTIVANHNCTRIGKGPDPSNTGDEFGHGTHVAGIIAGCYRLAIDDTQRERLRLVDRRDNADWGGMTGGGEIFRGMAYEAKIHNYKVLADDGAGLDSWIIKALDHIAETNEKAGRLQIHGVNLSLGGYFDTEAFGCGRTPLCDELRRLWSQGVVVVIAAGNSGQAQLLVPGDSGEAEEQSAMMAISIEDPANLEDAIAVGSVHRTKPSSYGVSFFSSRGPTADGRQKPDCVAPGEQILSCRNDWVKKAKNKYEIDDLYVPLDGTSMAAPHVSGLIAAFLSQRTEYIGQPNKVKKLLLQSCTDLGRDRSVQGAGLPNLVRMLVGT